ncbi:MAG: cytochrome C [Candidatus Omnitrophica bacterium]|nr:cytochrome C [Candidatus Omnitrophota bacterium]
MIFIFGYFTWYAMRKAVENDRRMEKGEPTVEQAETNDKVLVFPYLIFIEFVVALAYAVGLVLWSLFLKAPLEEPANPTVSPNPSKAPWYFLGLQEMLVYFDPWIAGVLLPTLIILGLCAIPYIDRDPGNSGFYCYQKRRLGIQVYLFGFWVLWILLIVVGTFLRGPNWNFFGPFERWDVHKVVPLVNVNLSDLLFIKWLGWGLPKEWYLREAPGILLIFTYLILPPAVLAKTVLKGLCKKLEPVRYSILMFLLLVMLSLPIKMYLRWAFNLKYLVAIPEFFFNI